MQPPPLVAHRGYALRYPENTLAAVAGAVEHGARLVEVDVQLSRERTPFLFHDADLARLTGRRGSFLELDDAGVAELRAAEAGRFGERFADEPVASLAAFAELLARSPGVEAFVEAKGESIAAFGAEPMLEALLGPLALLGQRWILISFELEILEAARARGAPRRLGPVLRDWKELAGERVRALAPEFVFCDRRKLPRHGPLDGHGAKLVVYEVTDPREARGLLERGVFAIETFEVAELAAALAQGARP